MINLQLRLDNFAFHWTKTKVFDSISKEMWKQTREDSYYLPKDIKMEWIRLDQGEEDEG